MYTGKGTPYRDILFPCTIYVLVLLGYSVHKPRKNTQVHIVQLYSVLLVRCFLCSGSFIISVRYMYMAVVNYKKKNNMKKFKVIL